jgi:uncharacterized membrane protein YdcZ (DUF606 family)
MNTKAWIHSIVAGAISAFATSVTAAIIDPSSFNFTASGINHILAVGGLTAALAILALLKQSPLPDTSDSATSSTTGAKIAIFLLAGILGASIVGCTASEINSVVTKIEAYVPTAISLVSEALTIYEAVGTSSTDTSSTSASLTTINADLAQLKTFSADYLAASSSATKATAWSNIEALVDTLATDADNVLAVASVKNSDSKAAGVVVLASLDAAIHIIDAYVSSAQSTATVQAKLAKRTVKLRQVAAMWSAQDRQRVADAAGVPYGVALSYAESRGF